MSNMLHIALIGPRPNGRLSDLQPVGKELADCEAIVSHRTENLGAITQGLGELASGFLPCLAIEAPLLGQGAPSAAPWSFDPTPDRNTDEHRWIRMNNQTHQCLNFPKLQHVNEP